MNGDLQLVARYAETHSADSFSELVGRYQAFVYGVCLRILRDPSSAEDATQECFLGLAREAASVRISLAGWLHHRATGLAIDTIRKRDARTRREKVYAQMKACNNGDPAWDEIAPLIDQCLDELPDQLRHVVVEHFLHRRPQTELAKEMGLSKATVCRRVNCGIEALRKKLKKAGVTVASAFLVTLLTEKVVVAAPAALTIALGKIAIAGIGKAAGAGAATSGSAAVGLNVKIGAIIAAGAIAAGGVTTYVATKDRPQSAPVNTAPSAQKGLEMGTAVELTRAFMVLLGVMLAPDSQQEIRVDVLTAGGGPEASYLAQRRDRGFTIGLRDGRGLYQPQYVAGDRAMSTEGFLLVGDIVTGRKEMVDMRPVTRAREGTRGTPNPPPLKIKGHRLNVIRRGDNVYITGHREGEMIVVQVEAPWGEASNGLQCRLRPELQVVEVPEGQKPQDVEIYLTYELRHVGEQWVKFLRHGTPLHGGSNVQVAGPDGEEVRYWGRMRELAAPTKDSFTTILPNQTLGRRVRLLYDFAEPGTYTISTTKLAPARGDIAQYYGGDEEKIEQNRDFVWTGTLPSNTVKIEVVRPDGKAANVPARLPQNGDGNFVLYVSNQSGDINPVDIRVHIDGKLAVDRTFDVAGGRGFQHNWIRFQFALDAGKHTLSVVTVKGGSALAKEFEIGKRKWAVINFFTGPVRGESLDTPTGRFTFDMQDTPMLFE